MAPEIGETAYLQLEDGTIYKGISFGAAKCVAGEVGEYLVFHDSVQPA